MFRFTCYNNTRRLVVSQAHRAILQQFLCHTFHFQLAQISFASLFTLCRVVSDHGFLVDTHYFENVSYYPLLYACVFTSLCSIILSFVELSTVSKFGSYCFSYNQVQFQRVGSVRFHITTSCFVYTAPSLLSCFRMRRDLMHAPCT